MIKYTSFKLAGHVLLITVLLGLPPSTSYSATIQKKGYKNLKVNKVKFEAPVDMRVLEGTVPGELGTPHGTLRFWAKALTAVHPRERFFATAGYAEPTWTLMSNEALEADAAEILENILEHINVPGVGRLTCDSNDSRVSKYESAGAPFREVTCTLDGTGDDYRIYALLQLKHRRLNNALQVFAFFVGCPEEKIKDFDLVMSSMIASLRFT
jgi:hypothetical protein